MIDRDGDRQGKMSRCVHLPERRKNLSIMGGCQRRYAVYSRVLLALSRMDTEKMDGHGENEALTETVVKQARTSRHPCLMASDANMDPVRERERAQFISEHSSLSHFQPAGQFPVHFQYRHVHFT